jgi:hypothetical protein
MKIETKTYIFLMFPLLIGVVLYFASIFHEQLSLTQHDFAENCNNQTNSLAALCTEAIAGGDFVFLNNTIAKLGRQNNIIKAFIFEHPGRNILVSTVTGEYGKIFNYVKRNSKKQKTRFFLDKYFNPTNSEPIFEAVAPIFVSKKKWATLMILFDKSQLLQNENDLKRKLALQGLLVFGLGSILLFGAAKIIAKSYSAHLKKAYRDPPIDAFALPDLKTDTVLSIKRGQDTTLKQLSPDEEKIAHLFSSPKPLHHILKKSPLDELLTFELITGLLARDILEIKSV